MKNALIRVGSVIFVLTVWGCEDDDGSGTGTTQTTTGDGGTTAADTGTGGTAETGTGSDGGSTTDGPPGSDETTDTGASAVCGDGSPATNEVCYFGAITLPMGSAPSDAAIGDFDGDGALDVTTANQESGDVSVRWGDGIGNFSEAISVAMGAGPVAVAAGDFDGDGDDDIATANIDGTVSFAFGHPSRELPSSNAFLVGEEPSDIEVVDLRGQGMRDLVVGNRGSRDYHTLVSDGGGGFLVQGPFSTGEQPVPVAAVGAGSFNASTDNVADIFVAGGLYMAGSPGEGDGTANDSEIIAINVGGGDVTAMATGFIDGDEFEDILLANEGGDRLHLMRGNGDASFTQVDITVGTAPTDVAVADVSGDGITDIIVISSALPMVSIMTGSGNGQWGTVESYDVGGGPSGVKLGDLNADGVPDIVVSNRNTNDTSVLLSAP